MKTNTAAIYGFSEYRDYLKWALSAEQLGRGGRQNVATFLRCQPSFISQVLSGRNDLSLEHAYRLNLFFKHSKAESEYFMLLVQIGKAGSVELKNFFLEQLERARRENLQVGKVVQNLELNEANILRYFSSFLSVASHLLVSIPAYQSEKALREKLGASERDLGDALDFLEGAKLIKRIGEKIVTGEAHIHIRKTSPYAAFASQQIRLHMLQLQNIRNDKSLLFGTHFTISKQGLARVRQKMLDFIGELNQEIAAADPESMCTIVLDLHEQ